MKHLRHVFFVLLWTATSAVLLAQKSPTAFSLLESSDAETSLTDSPEREKRDRAEKIYRKLIAAKGDYRYPVPAFRFTRGETYMAFMEQDGLSIGLEEKAYDILDEFGDAGIAFFLAHEVSHFYEKHTFQQSVLDNFVDTDLNAELLKAKAAIKPDSAYTNLHKAVMKGRRRLTKLSMETESDFLGAYLAYSAGYDVQKIPDMFEALYTGYGLKEERLFGYASLEERKAMGVEAEERMNDFVDIFEIANLLTAMQRYDDARVCYRYILQKYQGREVYNNLGVLTVLEALTYFDKNEMPYRLPLELDLTFNSASKTVEDTEALRQGLLEEAERYFKNAISLDGDFAPAYLNLACVHFLKKDYDHVRFYAGTEAVAKAEADPTRFPNTAANARGLVGLIDLVSPTGDKANGMAQLEAVADRSAVAKENLRLAKGEALPDTDDEDDDDDTYTLRWKVDGMRSRDLITATQDRRAIIRDLSLFEKAKLKAWARPGAKVYEFKPGSRSDRGNVLIAITDRGSAGEAASGFPVGVDKAEIIAKYGEPNNKIETVAGQIWAYDNALIILDGNGKLRRWAVVD